MMLLTVKEIKSYWRLQAESNNYHGEILALIILSRSRSSLVASMPA